NFGDVRVGETAVRGFQVTNGGGGVIHADIAFQGDPSFTVTGGVGQHTLASGATVAVTVSYTPPQPGDDTAAITITHDAPSPSSPVQVSLTGTGTTEATASITTSATSLAFGSVLVGQ